MDAERVTLLILFLRQDMEYRRLLYNGWTAIAGLLTVLPFTPRFLLLRPPSALASMLSADLPLADLQPWEAEAAQRRI